MSIKHKIKFKKMDRDRGTSSAVLRSSGPKQRPERVATMLGVSGESARRSVSTDEIDYQGGGAYKAILKLFSNQLDDEKFAEHCKKFFKGEESGDTSGPAQTVTQKQPKEKT